MHETYNQQLQYKNQIKLGNCKINKLSSINKFF